MKLIPVLLSTLLIATSGAALATDGVNTGGSHQNQGPIGVNIIEHHPHSLVTQNPSESGVLSKEEYLKPSTCHDGGCPVNR